MHPPSTIMSNKLLHTTSDILKYERSIALARYPLEANIDCTETGPPAMEWVCINSYHPAHRWDDNVLSVRLSFTERCRTSAESTAVSSERAMTRETPASRDFSPSSPVKWHGADHAGVWAICSDLHSRQVVNHVCTPVCGDPR